MAKKLEIIDGKFTANEVQYTVTTSLTVGRFEEYEKLQHHVGFGVDFFTMFNTLSAVYELLNKQKFADSAVKIHNTINGVSQKLENRQHPALLLCSLFMNRDGEDLTRWSDEEAIRKIEDWKKEGFDIQDFFRFAVTTVHGLSDVYESLTQSILEGVQEEMNTTTSE